MGFGERISEAVRRAGTPLALGIDPREEDIPPVIREAARRRVEAPAEARAEAILEFTRALFALALDEGLPAVKLQSAFYEAAGPHGMAAFARALREMRAAGASRPLTIADVKRGDIGSTAEAYAAAYLGEGAPFGADAVTLSPFLGEDSLAPFVARAKAADGGLFLLVRTSNAGAADLQEQRLADGRTVSEAAAALTAKLAAATKDSSGYGCVGAVVGATAPGAARTLRGALPHSVLLVPGVGAQGASPADLAPFFDARGGGALVPVSRAVSGAWRDAPPGTSWLDACRLAIRRLRADLAATLPAK